MTSRPQLIETMRVEAGGTMPLLDGHIARLQASCAALAYATPDIEALRRELSHRVRSLDPTQTWRLRLLVAEDGSWSLDQGPLATSPDPLAVVVTGPRRSGDEAWLCHKTTRRPWYEDAARWLADHPDIFDVLYWNDEGLMCEGSRSNLYMQADDGTWLTPPLGAGLLPGVQRAALLQAGLVREHAFTREAFLEARARRISNALRGWRDVVIAA